MPDEKAFGTTTGTGVRADSQTLSGSDSYTITNAANDQNGGFSRTTTGTTTATLTEGGFATPHTQALSQAETGNYVSGRLTTGSALAGAAAQEVYRQMGNDLAHQYCFAAGTQVLLADGSRKAIESILAGELVLAADDDDPEGCMHLTVSGGEMKVNPVTWEEDTETGDFIPTLTGDKGTMQDLP